MIIFKYSIKCEKYVIILVLKTIFLNTFNIKKFALNINVLSFKQSMETKIFKEIDTKLWIYAFDIYIFNNIHFQLKKKQIRILYSTL